MAMSRYEKTGYFYLLLAMLLWSTAEVVVRIIIDRITPIQLSATRYAMSGIFLLPFLAVQLRRKGLRVTKTILAHAAWMSLVGLVASSLCYQYSLERTGAAIVATVFGASPLMVLILAAAVLGERMTVSKLAGVLAGLAGMVVLGLAKESAVFTKEGFALAVGACFCFSLFTVLVKRFAGPFAGLPITTLCALFGGAYLVPLAFSEGHTATFGFLDEIWLPVTYIAIGTTGMSYLLYFLGLERVEATRAVSVILLKPPLATLLAAVVLGEPVTWNLAASMALILGGLHLVIRKGGSARPGEAQDVGER